jgi:hypothetical protein
MPNSNNKRMPTFQDSKKTENEAITTKMKPARIKKMFPQLKKMKS